MPNPVTHMRFIFVLTLFLFAGWGYAQDTPNTPPPREESSLDTMALLSDEPLKSPRGAVFRSMLIPGWGQWYNEKRLKAIFTLGLNGALAAGSIHYHRRWSDEPAVNPNKGLRNRRNTYNWFLGLTYLLTIADAYVDAYLFKFDEAMDITLVPGSEQTRQWQLAVQIRF